MIKIRVTCPGGTKVTLDGIDPTTTTVYDLKVEIYRQQQQQEEEINNDPTSPTTTAFPTPPEYIRLICRGKKLDDDTATLSSLGVIEDRTAMMAIHNERYTNDAVGIATIQSILREAQKLQSTTPAVSKLVMSERITQLCCQLDNIETNGSDTLRQFRKSALATIQQIDNEYQEQKDQA